LLQFGAFNINYFGIAAGSDEDSSGNLVDHSLRIRMQLVGGQAPCALAALAQRETGM
jgi:hypothetical protein